MTLDEFQALAEQDQLASVYATGAYVATRWQQVYEAVLLYQMPEGVFVKFIHADAGQINVYLDYYRELETTPGNNSPGGLILCAEKRPSRPLRDVGVQGTAICELASGQSAHGSSVTAAYGTIVQLDWWPLRVTRRVSELAFFCTKSPLSK